MNRHKLMSRRDEYLKKLEKSPEEERTSIHFYNQLRNYYKRKWNAPLRLPRVNGVEVDLFRLYSAVKSLGGWSRVTNNDRWYDVARDVLELGEETLSADYCARLTYMRYLSKYEQFEQGNDTDDHDSDMMGSRSRVRGYSLYVTSECPIQQIRREIPDDQPQYDRLIKSLASNLPNEVDFALNTCAIMSAPGPFIFDLDRYPGLITLIVAQAGVFDDNSEYLQEQFLRAQQRYTKRDFSHFWSMSGIEDADVLKIFPLIKPNKYSKTDYQLFPLLKDENHEQKQVETVEFRVQQVLDIIRNLGFEAHNQALLANNWACLKFLIICVATEVYELRNSALDALSELASQICLSTDSLTIILLRLLRSFVFSEDRILVMRAAEIIGTLCINPENENIMCDFLEADILYRLFELISAKDVLICVNTLDSLYNISEAGRTFCERLAEVPRGIELLVNFCTIEASQFTTNGLYGIKVIEYQQHNHDQHMGHQMRQSTSYYHPQQQFHARTLPTPLQPLSIGSTSHRPQVVVSSKGDITSVASNKPILAAQLARPIMPTQQKSIDYQKREVSTLNGSQVKQIRIVNGNGEPVIIQQANQSVKIEEVQQSQPSNNDTIADETISTLEIDEEDESLKIDESLEMEVELVEVVETTESVEIVGIIESVEIVESSTMPQSSSINEDENIDVINVVDTDDENKLLVEDEPVLNGAEKKNGDGVLNGDVVLNGITKKSDQTEEPKIEVNQESTVIQNGTQHVKENGCVKPIDEDKEKPINGTIKPTKSKAKKRAATDTPANGSPKAKKTKATSKVSKKKKNGYIEPKDETTKEQSPTPSSTNVQAAYARVPNFMCEWDACQKYCHTSCSMIYHILHDHIDKENGTEPSTSTDLIYCRWPGCERTPRSRWSLITHLQENHCNDNALNVATRKRREMGDLGYISHIKQRLQEITPAIHHPGYTKFAAYDAIRRHAFNYLTRDITEDQQEGPVTKDLRLTSALILRNLAKNSAECRRRLRPHEGFISYMAMSRLESSAALAQCLTSLNPIEL